MDGLGVAAVLGAIAVLLAQVTTSYLQVQAANRTTAAVTPLVTKVDAMDAKLVDAAGKIEQVHVVTNSNYSEQKELTAASQAKLDALQEKLDEIIKQRDETALLALESTRARLEAAQAEVLRLSAAAQPAAHQVPLGGAVVHQPVTKENPLPVEVVEPPPPPPA